MTKILSAYLLANARQTTQFCYSPLSNKNFTMV